MVDEMVACEIDDTNEPKQDEEISEDDGQRQPGDVSHKDQGQHNDEWHPDVRLL
jgi:hypothetical protein